MPRLSWSVAFALACLFDGSCAFTCPAPSVHSVLAKRARPAVLSVMQESPQAWFEDDATGEVESVSPSPTEEPAPPAAPAAPAVPTATLLKVDDIMNTKWKVTTTHREDGWLPGKGQEQEFTLLADGSVVWGGQAGGFGTGGRWQLTDSTLEVIRKTPLGLVTGRDYYMAVAQASVNDKLQFEVKGIIRSYNAVYPVAVVADFVAERQPGRFVRNDDED